MLWIHLLNRVTTTHDIGHCKCHLLARKSLFGLGYVQLGTMYISIAQWRWYSSNWHTNRVNHDLCHSTKSTNDHYIEGCNIDMQIIHSIVAGHTISPQSCKLTDVPLPSTLARVLNIARHCGQDISTFFWNCIWNHITNLFLMDSYRKIMSKSPWIHLHGKTIVPNPWNEYQYQAHWYLDKWRTLKVSHSIHSSS